MNKLPPVSIPRLPDIPLTSSTDCTMRIRASKPKVRSGCITCKSVSQARQSPMLTFCTESDESSVMRQDHTATAAANLDESAAAMNIAPNLLRKRERSFRSLTLVAFVRAHHTKCSRMIGTSPISNTSAAKLAMDSVVFLNSLFGIELCCKPASIILSFDTRS
jgi:hypothetical protein